MNFTFDHNIQGFKIHFSCFILINNLVAVLKTRPCWNWSLCLLEALALLTEELQAEKKRFNEESLRRFQDEVRRRLAKRAQVCEKGQQLHPNAGVKSSTFEAPLMQLICKSRLWNVFVCRCFKSAQLYCKWQKKIQNLCRTTKT